MTAIGEVLVRHLGLIGELSDGDREALLSIEGEIRGVERGEDILEIGDHPTHVVVVLSGLLHRYTLGPHGIRQIHSFYLPTDTPSLETLHIGVMDNSLGALTRSQIGLVAHSELFAMMADRPSLIGSLWHETLVQAIDRPRLADAQQPDARPCADGAFVLRVRHKSAGGGAGRGQSLPASDHA